MTTKLFVNLPVKDLNRSTSFFSELGFEFFAMAEDMASVVISEHTQVMLLTEATFATYTTKEVADPTVDTEVILVVGVETRAAVDELVDKALAAGGTQAGVQKESDYVYQRGFADLDGHHWEALCLA